MMHTAVLIALNLLCLSALFWFFDVAYRRFRVDLLRFHLFQIRDQLFAAAAEKKISFNHPAYGMVRQTINGMIRFAHEISLWRMAIMLASHAFWSRKGTQREYSARFKRAVGSLTPQEASVISTVMRQAHFTLFSHMLHTSLLTFPVVLAAKLSIQMIGAVQGVIDRADESVPSPVLQMVDCEAYAIGEEMQFAEAA